MSFRIITGDWESVREDAQRVRIEVFVIEQNVPIELEWDEGDDVSTHGRAAMTGRRGVGFIEGDTVHQFLTARKNIIVNDVFIGSGVAKEDTLAAARCQFTVTTTRIAGNNSGG